MKKFGGYLLFVVLGVVLYNFVAERLKDFQAGDVGLGIATTSHEVRWRSLPINQVGGNDELIIPTIKQFSAEGDKIALLMGNSQLHAINYYREGNNLTVYRLNEIAGQEKMPMRFVQLSSPNINFIEMLINYLSLRQQNIRPDWVVVGATYRGFQLASIRGSFAQKLIKIDLTQPHLDERIVKIFSEELSQSKKKAGPVDAKSNQQKIEAFITQFSEQHWEAYRYRGNVRSGIKILPGMVYRNLLSNKTFYQGSETVEQLNMAFLRELIVQCRKDGVKMLIYQPPHPQSDDDFQYDRTSYDLCFQTVKGLANDQEGIYFMNFEKAIRLEYWGLDGSGRLDIFHFKDQAHQDFAQVIFDFMNAVK